MIMSKEGRGHVLIRVGESCLACLPAWDLVLAIGGAVTFEETLVLLQCPTLNHLRLTKRQNQRQRYSRVEARPALANNARLEARGVPTF